MPKKLHLFLLCFLQLHILVYANNSSITKGEPVTSINVVSYSKTNQIPEKLTETSDSEDNNAKLSKITTLLSVSIIGIFSLLTLALLKNINYRAKANKLLQEKNDELRLSKEKAEKANIAKAEFLSTITHELRTPLYAVTGLTHLLLDGNPTPEQKEHLNSLRFSGEYLLSLINNILDLNKLEAKKVDIEYIPFNLKKRISDVLIALNKPASNQKNTLDFSFDPAIPKNLKGDPLKVSQILINLIGNAIKFTSNGQINIRVKKVKDLGAKKVRLLFEIEDNGLGISKDKLENIFDNFSQESLQINRKYGGTGLGLSIVKNLLSLLGSEIQLSSEKNKGSTFFFELDFQVFNNVEDTPVKKALKEINFEAMHGKNVLVVEDNKINQLITCKILHKHEITTAVADNGEVAVEKVKNNKYDLILMDIHMPGISGVEASNQIRKFDMNTPIIALTAVTLSDHIEEFYANGINDVIPKPYKVEDFFSTLEKAFDGEYA